MPDFGLAFILNCKCANSTVKEACFKAMGLPTDRVHAAGNDVDYFSLADIYKNYKNLARVALVRNPYDRIVSFYTDKVIGKDHGPTWQREGFHYDMSFAECVEVITSQDPDKANQHYRPLWIDCSLDGKMIANIIVRFESLHECWKKVQNMSAKTLPDLGHVNKSARVHWLNYYDCDTLAKVRKYYRKDFKLFGYSESALMEVEK